MIRRSILKLIGLFLVTPVLVGQDYKLVWSDDFEDNTLNTAVWQYEVHGEGGGNNELQYYTDRSDNLEVKDGILTIIARKEQYLGKEYTSARINTRGKLAFQYGKIEARMKMPYGQGLWPALWMLGNSYSSVGWPDCGEIDIMEMIGGEGKDNTIHSTLHWGPLVDGGHPNYGQSYTLTEGIFADDFHIIETEWTENYVKTYCDGELFFTIDISASGLEAFHDPFFLIINLAVGGNWPGSPDATTVFPQNFQIDYIRLYQTDEMILVDSPAEEYSNDLAIAYPNPFYDSIIISASKPVSEIEILDYAGRILLANKCDGSIQNQVLTHNLPSGMYMCKIIFEDMNAEIVKIVK